MLWRVELCSSRWFTTGSKFTESVHWIKGSCSWSIFSPLCKTFPGELAKCVFLKWWCGKETTVSVFITENYTWSERDLEALTSFRTLCRFSSSHLLMASPLSGWVFTSPFVKLHSNAWRPLLKSQRSFPLCQRWKVEVFVTRGIVALSRGWIYSYRFVQFWQGSTHVPECNLPLLPLQPWMPHSGLGLRVQEC